jgi:hypothetical protein
MTDEGSPTSCPPGSLADPQIADYALSAVVDEAASDAHVGAVLHCGQVVAVVVLAPF